MNPRIFTSAIILALSLFSSSAYAAPKKGKSATPEVALTDAGKVLEAKYASMRAALEAEIEGALPKRDEAKVTAWRQAIQAEEAAVKNTGSANGAVKKMERSMESYEKLQASAKKAPMTFAEAEDEMSEILAVGGNDQKLAELLKSEKAYNAHIAAEAKQLQKKIEKAAKAAQEAQAALPEAIKAAEAAKRTHEKAVAATWQTMDALGMNGVLGGSQLDGKLAQYMVINHASPSGLAQFAEKSPENEKLIEQLLSNEALMVQMLVADGPNKGRYGNAMKIYTDIQKASAKAKEGIFQRLALAVSLGHAVPIAERGSKGSEEATFIDPVKRYLSYEKWYLDGELQPGFKDLSVWNLAMVVDGSDPDEIYAWGRQMLNNLRPDCIPRDGDTSVYVDVVNKEIAYTSSMVKNDLPEHAFMQNILSNGGICGRRAFFGRFILRAFGVPTTGRKQPGHATLAHWHPDGWETKLGGNWGAGARGFYSSMSRTRSSGYGADVNFLASTQAREDATAFMKVKRAQWIGTLVGEKAKPGLITYHGKTKKKKKSKNEPAPTVEEPVFWNELALQEQKRIIAKLAPETSKSPSAASLASKEPSATGKVTVDSKGVIIIPAAACSSPKESSRMEHKYGRRDLIVFVENKEGETLLHFSRYGTPKDSFEYTFDAPKGGTYQLVASVATPMPNHRLLASANGGADIEMKLPYTLGMWDETAPIEIELQAGKNVLTFHGPARVTMKEFKLKPVQ